MSQRSHRQKRAALRDQSPARISLTIYRELVRLVRDSPKPPTRPIGEWKREDQRHVIAPAIAWGWLMRVMRSGQAAIELEGRGFGPEAAPLVRSALEHAIRLLWAAEYGDEFVEITLLSQKKGLANMEAAQTDGWRFDPDFAEALQKRAAEASDDFTSLSTLTALKHIVDSNPDRLGGLYMAWLFDTQESHPSVFTAQHYYVADDSGHRYELFEKPRTASRAAFRSCFALLGAIDGYAKISGLSAYFEPGLSRSAQMLLVLSESLAADDSSR